MKNITKAVISSALLFATGYAVANDYKTTIEYRHEYRDGNEKHSDRVKAFIDTGNNIGFELDARYNNDGENEMFNSMSMNGSELSVFYYDKLNKNTVGLLGTSLDFSSAGIVYVPYARLNYSFDNGFRIQGRYKWKIWDYSQVGTDGSSYHSKIQQFDTWIGYKTGNWDFQYNFDYWKEMEDNGQALFDNGSTNYLQNFRLMYAIHTEGGAMWRPFMEIGDVSVDRYTDERQLRYRVGIKYTW